MVGVVMLALPQKKSGGGVLRKAFKVLDVAECCLRERLPPTLAT